MVQKTYTGDGPDDWSEIVGMPDEWDERNIATLIKKYEKRFPGQIEWLLKDSRAEVGEEKRALKFVAKEERGIGLKRSLSLPSALINEIKAAYPTMFRDKRHMAWFMKKFPQFVVEK
jgi:hypothetical protein